MFTMMNNNRPELCSGLLLLSILTRFKDLDGPHEHLRRLGACERF